MFFSKSHIYFLLFIVLTLFVYITADFSQYYIPLGQVLFPVAVVGLLFTFYQDLIDYNRTLDVCIYLLICLFVFSFHFFASYQIPNIRLLIETFFAFSFLQLKPEARLWIYDKFIRILAILLFFSIIEYILIISGVSFYVGESSRKAGGSVFFQGILNVVPVVFSSSFFRFHFITEEPGFIGTLCFFIIATINRQDYKKEYIIFTIAGIISFSLAFYLLYILWGISRLKPSNFKFLLIPLALYAIFYEPVNDMVVNRIVYKSEDGTLDNRNSFKMNRMFEEMWDNGQIIIGIGNRELLEQKEECKLGASTGVKSFMMQYGIIGFLLAFTSFSYIFFRYNKINYSNIVVLIFFWISFYQRSDLNLETNVVVLFSYSLAEQKKFLFQESSKNRCYQSYK